MFLDFLDFSGVLLWTFPFGASFFDLKNCPEVIFQFCGIFWTFRGVLLDFSGLFLDISLLFPTTAKSESRKVQKSPVMYFGIL
jgi:hypothetical protein